MAFATFFKLKSDRAGPVGAERKVYNFDHQVRTFSGGGDPVDVMLLQALFRIFYYEFINFPGSIPPPPNSTGVIKVDGVVGRQTRFHIEHYQQKLFNEALTKTTDGIMDPFKKQGVLTGRTQVKFQLEILNVDCLLLCKDNGEEEVHQKMIDLDVHADEIYPRPLRSALRVPKTMR